MNTRYSFSPFTEEAPLTVTYNPRQCRCGDCTGVKITPVPKEGDVTCDRCGVMFTPTPEAYVDNTVKCESLRCGDDGEAWKGEEAEPGVPRMGHLAQFILAGMFGLSMEEAATLAKKGEVTSYHCLCPRCREK